ncbi:TIGR00266 family protein [Candidatus Bathyarchaeota archaeon]|nr:MAG: TIGR00266 family protein [Candidatus Bathyarchaeota archaeon]RLG97676.1 MAG: TIGR00266 family protein [Candidatus Bathyarchaeota archaeon]HDJ04956.1 TIGR00266 family protein [Candidatus Bathyarchaeota archaeon]
MRYKILGSVMQHLVLELEPGEVVVAESGRLLFMSDNVKMETKVRGGFLGGLKRKIAGESFFMVHFSPVKGPGIVGFAAESPGKIIPVELGQGESMLCQRDAFLAAEEGVKIEAAFVRRLGAGLFGGEGLFLQRLTGPGIFFANIGGEIIEYDLKEGQRLLVDTSCVGMFQPSVTYDIKRVRGVRNILFGGESLFLVELTGPGKVWLQSMPVRELAREIGKYLSSGGGEKGGFSIDIGGFKIGR